MFLKKLRLVLLVTVLSSLVYPYFKAKIMEDHRYC